MRQSYSKNLINSEAKEEFQTKLTIKEDILNLLEKDRKFRLAIAGLIGLEEILKKLNQNERMISKLRKDMLLVFRRHDEILIKHSEEIKKLSEDMVEGFMKQGEEIARLRADMTSGFAYVERHISALEARWGIMSEAAFREGLRELMKRELGLKVERWTCYDDEGKVFGYPSQVGVDVAIHDSKETLVKAKSHIDASDVPTFATIANLYAEKTGRKSLRLLMVTPYAEDMAGEAARDFNIEVYTKA